MEAELEQQPHGAVPAGDGWFVVNVRDTAWTTHPTFGSSCRFESPHAEFAQLGINLRVLMPGQPNCLYHRESNQEDFLVLDGECVLVVEGQERPLRAWDFFHCPAGVAHVFVGAGEGPCVILMVGVRDPDEELLYPVDDVARRHGAAAERETPSPAEAYANYGTRAASRPAAWDDLPWA